jgi:hypothetical protein
MKVAHETLSMMSNGGSYYPTSNGNDK